ncbi:MAG TPA: penicillin-binding protein 2, partial [Burkholderiaceae bacterium]|nr:penicillin-binding protein 2 [Burkholderiaceae bacterium]
KYNAKNIDERHRDHALYSAFAPLDEPRVAVALVVENAGFGAANAAPIGTPRPISEVPLPGSTIDGSTASLSPLTPPAVIPAAASAPLPAASAAKPRVALNTPAEPKRVTR